MVKNRHSLRNITYHATASLRAGEAWHDSACQENACTPQYALVYISEGKAEFTDQQQQVWTVEAGQAFQRFPEHRHRVLFYAKTRIHYVALPSVIYQLMLDSEMPTLRTPIISPGVGCGFEQRQRKLVRQLSDEQPQLMMRVLTDIQQLVVDIHMLCAPKLSGHSKLIVKACRILGSNFQVRISPENIAKNAGVSYSFFRKEFRRVTGISPGNYRLQRRLERAQELLLLDENVGKIARELGYPDIYAFSAQFKKHCRLSPIKYAQMYRGV